MPDGNTRVTTRGSIEPEFFLKQYRDIQESADTADEVKADHKSKMQAAKSAGIDIVALKLVHKLRKMEPRDAQSTMRNTILYLRWLGVNILEQEELFTESTAGLTAHVQATQAAWEAERQGHRAGKDNAPLDTNPHRPGSEEHQRWVIGWHDGAQDRKASAKPGIQDISPHDGDGPNPEDGEDNLP